MKSLKQTSLARLATSNWGSVSDCRNGVGKGAVCFQVAFGESGRCRSGNVGAGSGGPLLATICSKPVTLIILGWQWAAFW